MSAKIGVSPEHRAAWPVVLVSMPFMDADQPSLQLGLLKAITSACGYPVSTLHANLDLAARLGADSYRLLAEHRGRMVGEWLFSVEAFGDAAPDPDGDLLDDPDAQFSYEDEWGEAWREKLLRIRSREIPAFLDTLVESFPWESIRVVGFTSTFQQNTASIALARRLKERHPALVTVVGGANVDGGMGLEYLHHVDCVDLVVVGEGDVAFPALLDALTAGADPTAVPGVAGRRGGVVVSTPPAAPLNRLDELPVPDYDEYFDRAERLGLLARTSHRTVSLPFESARGCWWGAKHHCVFCGLNGTSMRFRAKSASRVVDELAELTRRYRSYSFAAVDNIIDQNYLRNLLPMLVETGTDYKIFYEVKANLTREQVRLLARAGVRRIQPGIESLSSSVLHEMRKGARAARNVNLLRWARYYGVEADWNLIWGFPGDDPDDYAMQASMVSHLIHLQPPAGGDRIWMERFSPLYTDPARFPVRRREPERSYRYVYPTAIDLEQVAYFFDYEFVTTLPETAYAALRGAVREWQQAWAGEAKPELTYWSSPGLLQIYDGRYDGREGTYTFDGLFAEIYRACSDRPVSIPALRERVGADTPVEELREILDEFRQRGLMFLDGDLALSLALPATSGR